MAANKKSPCYCSAVMAVVIIVLTVLTLTGTLQPVKWPGVVIIILAGLMGIISITGWCCMCLSKDKKDSGSCCQPPSQEN